MLEQPDVHLRFVQRHTENTEPGNDVVFHGSILTCAKSEPGLEVEGLCVREIEAKLDGLTGPDR